MSSNRIIAAIVALLVAIIIIVIYYAPFAGPDQGPLPVEPGQADQAGGVDLDPAFETDDVNRNAGDTNT